MFQKEQVDLKGFPVENIKIYNAAPQVNQKGYKVEIYLTTTEIILGFESKSEARKFAGAINELVTGKSKSERGAAKVKGAVNLVDNTLGINTVGTIKGVVENGVVGTVFGGLGRKAQVQAKGANTLATAVSVTNGLLGKNLSAAESPKIEANPAMSVNDQIETLKKLKELLDGGIITQKEFDAKKKQVMGL